MGNGRGRKTPAPAGGCERRSDFQMLEQHGQVTLAKDGMMTTISCRRSQGARPPAARPTRRRPRRCRPAGLHPGEAAGGVEGRVVGHLHHFVRNRGVEDARHEAGADALDRMRAARAARQHRAGGGLDGLRPWTPGFFALRVSPDTGDGAARAHASHEDVHLTIGVGPDFLGGGGPVNGHIGGLSNCCGMK